jgi:hypothetical protein
MKCNSPAFLREKITRPEIELEEDPRRPKKDEAPLPSRLGDTFR